MLSIHYGIRSSLAYSATTMTQTQLSEHARSMVTKISPEKDVSLVTTYIPRALASLVPKPILYYNYNVGECGDLIFGVSLADYATSRGLGEAEIPKIVRICIQEVDERGLESEGIYRVSDFLCYSSSPILNIRLCTGVGTSFCRPRRAHCALVAVDSR